MLVIAITLSFMVPFLYYAAMKCLMSWNGGSFDRWGLTWILLKTGYYGLVGSLLSLAVFHFNQNLKLALLLTTVSLALISTDMWSDRLSKVSLVDRLIGSVGYLISRTFPYVAHDRPVPSDIKAAMEPHTSLTAFTPVGKIDITSGIGLLRTITWEGASRSVELMPCNLEKTRGLHFPMLGLPGCQGLPFLGDESWPGDCWQEYNGITRCSFTEGQMDFSSKEAAVDWIQTGRHRHLPFVYNRNGLVVGWSKSFDQDTLTIETWQLLVNGEKPFLPDADEQSVIFHAAASQL